METLTFTAPSGVLDFFVLPEGSPLADWEDNSEYPTEGERGHYSVNVDPSISKVWRLFRGSLQPSSWDDWLQVFIIPAIAVLPSRGQDDRDYLKASIEASIDADLLIARTVLDSVGEPIILPTCDFVLCDKNQKHLATIPPTISGSNYTVQVPRAFTKLERTIFFALRVRDSSNLDLDRGTIQFIYAATSPV